MSNTPSVGGDGVYKGYEGVLANVKKVMDKCEELKKGGQMPKGFSFAVKENKYLCLQWKNPFTGTRTPKSAYVPFDESGVYQARDKAWKIKDALSKFTTASEFDEWYKREIKGINEVVNDLKTYREIIQELEDEYFNGLNIHTKRPRSRDISNDVSTWKNGNFHFKKNYKTGTNTQTWKILKLLYLLTNKERTALEIELFKIREISLHEYKPEPNTLPECICAGFNKRHSKYMTYNEAPATEIYAFRHLGNQLGEMYGVPQEIRARSMGHSVQQNQTTYKKRKNLQTTVDILLNHSKQPLSLELAKSELERLGFDLEEELIQSVLKVIYQLE